MPVAETDGFLNYFRLEYESSALHHGKISGDRISVGGIEYGNSVSGVQYSVCSGATISPDPEVYVRNWPKSVVFTVKKENGETKRYTLDLPDYKGSRPGTDVDANVIFFTDFDEADGIPDPSVWSLCKKGNSTWSRYMSESYDQAYVEDGNLILKAEKVDGEYKAGGVESYNLKSFKNARVEISAKFVKTGGGGFPALWLMPQNPVYNGHPDCGEIDIMELLNNDGYVYQTVHNHYRTTLGNEDPLGFTTTDYKQGEYNIYAVEYTEESIVFKVNDKISLVYPNLHLENEPEMRQWPYNTDFYLILNYALGGPGTWPGPIDDADLPLSMAVDWIKVTDLSADAEKPVVMGYMTIDDYQYDEKFESIDWSSMTHVIPSFAFVKSDATLDLSSMEKNLDEVIQKAHSNNVKVIASYISAGKGEFEAAIQTPELREKLAENIVAFAHDKGLDGVDIDYEEYDGLTENVPNLLDLFDRIRSKLKEHLIMTSTMNAGSWLNYGKDWHRNFDYVNLMIYDAIGGHNGRPVQHASYENFVNDIKYANTVYDIPLHKIVAGVPFYGYSWEEDPDNPVAVRYGSIVSDHPDDESVVNGDQVGQILYNGKNTIRLKSEYVVNNGVGGIMAWQLFQDASEYKDQLLPVMGDVVLRGE